MNGNVTAGKAGKVFSRSKHGHTLVRFGMAAAALISAVYSGGQALLDTKTKLNVETRANNADVREQWQYDKFENGFRS